MRCLSAAAPSTPAVDAHTSPSCAADVRADDSFEHEVRVAGGDDAPPRAVAIFHVAHPQLIARNHSRSNAAIVARRMRDAADEVCEHDSGPPE